MTTINLDLNDDLVALLRQLNESVETAARELLVLELYRREMISSGKAAALLGMERVEFITLAEQAGIPYFRMSPEEWEAERAESERL